MHHASSRRMLETPCLSLNQPSVLCKETRCALASCSPGVVVADLLSEVTNRNALLLCVCMYVYIVERDAMIAQLPAVRTR